MIFTPEPSQAIVSSIVPGLASPSLVVTSRLLVTSCCGPFPTTIYIVLLYFLLLNDFLDCIPPSGIPGQRV